MIELKKIYEKANNFNLRLLDSFVSEVENLTDTNVCKSNRLGIQYGRQECTLNNFKELYREYDEQENVDPDDFNFHIGFEKNSKELKLYIFSFSGNTVGLSVSNATKDEAVKIHDSFRKIFGLTQKSVEIAKKDEILMVKENSVKQNISKDGKRGGWFNMSNPVVYLIIAIIIILIGFLVSKLNAK